MTRLYDEIASGRARMPAAMPAEIAESLSDLDFTHWEEEAQQSAYEERLWKAKEAILEGDVRRSDAWRDQACELVELVDHLMKTGASLPDIGIAATDWLRDRAERQARYELEEES